MTSPRRHVVIGPEHVGKGPSIAQRPAPSAPAQPARPPSDATALPQGPAGCGSGSPPPRQPSRPRSPGPSGPRAPRLTARRVWRIALVVVLALVLLVVGVFAFGWWQFSRIERVEVSSLAPGVGSGTNYLIVGSDSREGISEDDPNAGAILGPDTIGSQRTDTIMVMRVGSSGASLLSIPRDLWVRNPVTDEMGRINAVHQSGPGALVQVVNELGIPIQHYMEVDFVSFGGLVDGVGGITVPFDYPTRDLNSGLDVAEPGEATLDGAQALAFVRSRYYEELVDGSWEMDGTGDLGRAQRQRLFLSTLMGEVASTRNPWTLAKIAGSMGPGLRIDQDLSYFDALRMMWALRGGLGEESTILPVTPRVTSGGAFVFDLETSEAQQVINQFLGL